MDEPSVTIMYQNHSSVGSQQSYRVVSVCAPWNNYFLPFLFFQSLVEKLFQNEIGINEFTASFKELRTLAHLRHIKADKMKELVLEIRRNGASNSVYQNTNPIIPRRKSGTNSSSTSPPYQLPYPPAHSPAYPHAQPAGQSYPQYSW